MQKPKRIEHNNNMSLVTEEGKPGDTTWSLIYWKFRQFDKEIPVIVPFVLQLDKRGILRATTTIPKIKSKGIFFSPELNSIATGERRMLMIEGFCERIISGFSWKQKQNYRKNEISRYRLITLLNSPDIILKSDFDVRHLGGIKELLKSNKALETLR